jgi:hypothetical protein
MPVVDNPAYGPLIKPTVTTTANDIVTAAVSVQGTIKDEKGTLLHATIQFLDPTSDISAIYDIPDGGYTAWTAEDPNTSFILFKSHGFADQKLSFTQLAANPNVVMKEGIPYWMIAVVLGAALFVIRSKKKKGNNVGKIENKDLVTIAILIGGVIGVTLIIKILKTLGLWGDPTTPEATNPDSPWKPTFYKKFTSFTYTITEQEAKDFSDTIYNAFGVFQDDFSAILGVFTQLQTQAEVSYLADIFQQQHDVDLLNFLTDGGGVLPWDGLSTTHLENLIALVKKLPSH